MKIVPVIPVQGEARADSRDIAKALGNQHKSVLALIGEYQTQFQAFGVLPFETAKPTGNLRGGRPVVYALLNEDQCYFLLTLVRNSERVVELKLQLVQAFGRLRRLDAPAPLDLAGMFQQLAATVLQPLAAQTAQAIKTEVAEAKEEIRAEIAELAARQPITPAQAHEIQQLIGELARRMGGKPFHYAQAWRQLKDKFKVHRYEAIEAQQFSEATRFIHDLIAAYKGRPVLLCADA